MAASPIQSDSASSGMLRLVNQGDEAAGWRYLEITSDHEQTFGLTFADIDKTTVSTSFRVASGTATRAEAWTSRRGSSANSQRECMRSRPWTSTPMNAPM